MKPLEPGCLAMIVGHPIAKYNGTSVTCVKFVTLGDVVPVLGGLKATLDLWEIDTVIEVKTTTTTRMLPYEQPKHLMRIGDPPKEHAKKEDQELCNVL